MASRALFRSLLILGALVASACASDIKTETSSQYISKSGYFYIKPDEIVDLKSMEHVSPDFFKQCKISKIIKLQKDSIYTNVYLEQGEQKILITYHPHQDKDSFKIFTDAFSVEKLLGLASRNFNSTGPLKAEKKLCAGKIQIGDSLSDLFFVKGLHYGKITSTDPEKSEEILVFDGHDLLFYEYYYIKNERIVKIEEKKSFLRPAFF